METKGFFQFKIIITVLVSSGLSYQWVSQSPERETLVTRVKVLADLFEYLCYGSTAIIHILIFQWEDRTERGKWSIVLVILSQQTRNICTTFVQFWANVVQMLYKWFVFAGIGRGSLLWTDTHYPARIQPNQYSVMVALRIRGRILEH